MHARQQYQLSLLAANSEVVLVLLSAVQLNEGTVIAVGAGLRNKAGELIPNSVKEGDTVMLPEYGGQQVVIDNEK